jgi:serine protease AprX
MIKYLLVIFISISAYSQASCQLKYWVFFTDKPSCEFDPYSFFDAKAIDRRIKEGRDLYDKSDWPVSLDYVASCAALADSVSAVSRWLNAVCLFTDDQRILQINDLNFVREVVEFRPIGETETSLCAAKETLSPHQEAILIAQIGRLGHDILADSGFTGKGMRIAVFDAGFKKAHFNEYLAHLFSSNKIIGTYDFVKRDDYVYDFEPHGAHVLSCITGYNDDQQLGLATESEFILIRTEQAGRERYSEEENWVAALELADKLGADIINSSLGYTNSRYFKEDMNGRTGIISRAANTAASKGILVVNAMGNDGDTWWEIMGSPADADSVLTVGGIDPWTGYHTDFSSYGPTADKRSKPNVCAFGHAMGAGPKGLHMVSGTSFASPLVAGYAACIWQAYPDLKVMELFDKITQSGNLYPYYDYAHGTGVPDAQALFAPEVVDTTFDVRVFAGNAVVTLRKKYAAPVDGADLHAARINSYEYGRPPVLVYYHIENSDGVLEEYGVILPDQRAGGNINFSQFKKGTLRIFFKGYLYEHKL